MDVYAGVGPFASVVENTAGVIKTSLLLPHCLVSHILASGLMVARASHMHVDLIVDSPAA